jgi:hypothetical protein
MLPVRVPVREVHVTPSVELATDPFVPTATKTPLPKAMLSTSLKADAKLGIVPFTHVSPLSVETDTNPFDPPTIIREPLFATHKTPPPYDGGGVVGDAHPDDTVPVSLRKSNSSVPPKKATISGGGGGGGAVFSTVSIKVSKIVSISTTVT